MSPELQDIWTRVKDDLAVTVGEPTYRIWLAQLRALELSADRLVIAAPPQAQRWIHDRFGKILQEAVERVLQRRVRVELVADGGESARGRRTALATGRSTAAAAGRECRAAGPRTTRARSATPSSRSTSS